MFFKVLFSLKVFAICSAVTYVSPQLEKLKSHNISVLLENVEHCGGEPEQAANLHKNRLSFTLEIDDAAEAVAFRSIVYVRPEAVSPRRV